MSITETGWNATFDYSLTVALRALAFVKNDQPILRRFLSNSRLSHIVMERRPLQPQDLAVLLDFLIADEPALQAFSRRADLPPEVAYEARRILAHRPRQSTN
jgi:hypothetical protein